MNTFADRLRSERISKGLTQKQLANAVGITYNAICNYEAGYREPSIDLIIKLCKVLEISSDYLIGLSND